jgi:glycosyltransferase involved in cell wall biosynthesis
MPTPIYLSLILPAYNEAASIATTLREVYSYLAIQPYGAEVIVVADGDDGTDQVVAALQGELPELRLIASRERRGKGYSVRQGVFAARGQIIGYADADNKTPIAELEAFLPALAEGEDLVLGSRAMRGSRVEVPQPLYRRLGSKAFSLAMHLLVGLWHISDTQCGFKFFQRHAALAIFECQQIDGYMFDVEILCIAEQAGYRIRQIPVRWRDDNDSRYDVVQGTWRNFRELLRIRFGAQARPVVRHRL